MTTQKIIKQKKKWFMAVAPEIYKSKEIAEIPAFEPDNLLGRMVEVNLMQLTGIPKDQQKKVLLKVTEVKGEKAYTVPAKFYLVDGYIQRSARKYKERFIRVLTVKTKDGKSAVIKYSIMAEKNLHQKVRAHILKDLEEKTIARIGEINAFDLFNPGALDKLATEIKKEVRYIYPIDKLQVWKLTLI